MRILFALLVLLPPMEAQTVAWLRYGGPESRKRVTGIAAGSPITLTAPNHGFNPGDTIYCHYIRGVSAANGYRRVKAVNGDGFTVTDFDNVDVASQGTYLQGGFCGKVAPYTLPAHPRGLLNGPGGDLTLRLLDPDGIGPLKSPKATASWPPYNAILTKYGSMVTNPSAHHNNCSANGIGSGPAPFHVALAWLADKSKTNYRAAALNWLNNAEKMIGCGSGFGDVVGWYDENRGITGGLNDGEATDSLAFKTTGWPRAYSVMREEMTPAERQTFANKILNGALGESCDNRFQTQSGAVSLVNSTTITGVGTTFTSFSPGQWVFFSTTTNLVAYRQAKIASIQSDTSMTLSYVSGNASPGAAIYQNMDRWGVLPAWTETSCGAFWVALHHGYAARPLSNARTTRVVSGPDGDDVPPYNFVVEDAEAFVGLPLPFYVIKTGLGGEWSRVSAVNGNTLTIDQRGLFGSAQVATRTGFKDILSYTPYRPEGGLSTTTLANEPWLTPYYDNPLHNLNWARTKGMLEAGYLLADDDPRALRMFEKAWNVMYDFPYWYGKNMWTGTGQGGYSYDPPRWQNWMYETALIGKQLSPPLDITDGEWLYKAVMIPPALQWPRTPTSTTTNTNIATYSDSGSDPYMEPQKYVTIAYAQYLFPSKAETGYAMWWYRQKSGWPTRLLDTDGLHQIAPYLIFTEPDLTCPGTGAGKLCTDYTAALPPSYFFTEQDFDPPENPDNAFGLIASKSNWGTDASFVFSTALGRGGDHTGPNHGPGTYRLFKRGFWLMAAGANHTDGARNYFGNFVQIDPELPYCSSPTATNCSALATGGLATGKLNGYGQASAHYTVDRKFGGSGAAFWRVNGSKAFDQGAQVTRHLRNVIHFKGAGQNDYVVVHDDVATAIPKRKARYLICYSEGELNVFRRSGYDLDCVRSRATGSAQALTKVLRPTDVSKILPDFTINVALQKIGFQNVSNQGGTGGRIVGWYTLIGVKQGKWQAVCTEAASPCTVFTVYDPDGVPVTTYTVGATGNAYYGNMRFEISTPASPYQTGDLWNLAVTPYETSQYAYAGQIGNGTLSEIVFMPGSEPGEYQLVCEVAGCASFQLKDPYGQNLGEVVAGQNTQASPTISMRVTAGSIPFVPGDGWRIPMVVSPTMHYMTIDDGETTSSEFLTVHQAVEGGSSALPPVESLAVISSNATGAIIRDPLLPRIALFDKDGSAANTNVTWSIGGVAIPAHHLVSGLAPGRYEIRKNGSSILTDVAVDRNGLLEVIGHGDGSYEAIQTVNLPPLEIVSLSPLPDGVIHVAYYDPTGLVVAGGTQPYTWSVAGGEPLPAGLALSTQGFLTGTPVEAITRHPLIQVCDANLQCVARVFQLQINGVPPHLSFTGPSAMPDGTVQTAYPTQTLQATGGTPPYSYSLASGALPAGLSFLGPGNQTLSGTPSTSGTYAFTLRAADSGDPTDTDDRSYTITILPGQTEPLEIQEVSLPQARVGQLYEETFLASGGTAPFTWTVSEGGLCPGLTLQTNGRIQGTPTQLGSCQFQIRVVDSNLLSAERNFEILTYSGLPSHLALHVNPVAQGALLKFGRAGLDANWSCQVGVWQGSTFVQRVVENNGPGRRYSALSGLLPGSPYEADLDCGGEGISFQSFTTPNAADGLASLRIRLAAPPGAVEAAVEWGLEHTGENQLRQSCAAACEFSLSALQRGRVYRIRHTYYGTGGAVIGISSQRFFPVH